MAPAMQPAEIQFAQRLASHEKGIRDRAVKKLRQYLSVKTQRETGGRPAVSRAAWRSGRGPGPGPGGAAGGAGKPSGTGSHSCRGPGCVHTVGIASCWV